MRETWYVLEDGTPVHPSEVTSDEKGVLTHKNGPVAMRGEFPRSTGVDVDEKTGKRVFDGKGDHDDDGSVGGSAPAKKTAEMKPEPAPKAAPKPGYKTRKAK